VQLIDAALVHERIHQPLAGRNLERTHTFDCQFWHLDDS
jgi:hypothetical protein